MLVPVLALLDGVVEDAVEALLPCPSLRGTA
jgi:hypothetical protein